MTKPTKTEATKTKPAKTKPAKTKRVAKIAPPFDCNVAATPMAGPRGKIGLLVTMLGQTDGATINAMTSATGWQAHSVRGAISGSVKKALGLNVTSEKTEAARVYRIAAGARA